MPYVKSECSGVRNFAEKSFGDSAQPEGQSDSARIGMAEDSIAKVTGPSKMRHHLRGGFRSAVRGLDRRE